MCDNGFLSVPNLEKWQHYKDRCPPWIKLHRDILNDYKYSCLQDASKLHLLMIWLLASQMDNKIPADPEWIAIRINAKSKVDIKGLVKQGFLIHASNTLAECKQDALIETETETETETKNIYGEMKNVKLTSKEFKKLIAKFGDKETAERIDRLSLYLSSKNKRYKSHYATILSWAQKEEKTNTNGGGRWE